MKKHISNEIIGGKCKKIRERMGLSQEQMAQKIGITLRNYVRFERGDGHSTQVLDWFIDNGGLKIL